MSQEIEYPTLLSSSSGACRTIKQPTCLSSQLDRDTRATTTKVGDTGVTGAIDDTWGNQVTCCSLSGMKKLFSGLRLPWGHPAAGASPQYHVQHDKPKSPNESAVPSVALLELSGDDLHILEAIEEATGKPWYRQSYSSFPKPKGYVAKKCATQSLSACNVTEQHQKSIPCFELVAGIKLPILRKI